MTMTMFCFCSVSVTTARPQVCHSSKFVKVTSPHGYLSSTVTTQTTCGSATTPWVVEAEPGQRVNLTLLDFGAQNRQLRVVEGDDDVPTNHLENTKVNMRGRETRKMG